MRSFVLLSCLLPIALTAQTLDYGWPNLGDDPCSEWISCPGGCTACNTPVASSATLIGAAAAWMGVSHCPHAKGDGDSVVETDGWTVEPDEAMVIISVIVLQPLQVDSIIVDREGTTGGCERLRSATERIRRCPRMSSRMSRSLRARSGP